MARIDTLTNYLTDVATAIKTKKGDNTPILASNFDTEIANLPSGGGIDIEDYFIIEPTQSELNVSSSQSFLTERYIKQVPQINIPTNIANLELKYFTNSSTTTGSYGLDVFPKIVFGDNVVSTEFMFSGGAGPLVTTIDTSGYNTTNVTNMRYMFYTLSGLLTLDCAGFNTKKVTSMQQMFGGCSKLTSLDISSFETDALTNAASMLNGCNAMQHLDMRNFDFTTISNTSYLFGRSTTNGIPDACEVIVKDTTQKEWVNTNFSRLTNVKTVAEYESE